MDEQIKVDNLIIGGGPAGLTAAYLLLKEKSLGSVELIESNEEYLGGISRTEKKNEFRFDIGGHRFFSKSSKINDLWDEILPNGFIERKRKSRILFKQKFFNYPISASEALIKLGFIESILCGLSFIKAKMFPVKKPKSFHDWVANNFGERLYLNFFKTYTEKVWGMSCDEISADWAAQRIKGLDLIKLVLDSFNFKKTKKNEIKTLIKTFKYPKFGPGMMWESAGEKIRSMNGKISMGIKADNFYYNSEKKSWEVNCSNKKNDNKIKYIAKRIICSAAMRDVIENIYPPLKNKDEAKKLNYRDFITVAVMMKKEPNFDDNWIYIHDKKINAGRMQNYTSWSNYMAPEKCGCIGLEYFCNKDDQFWSHSNEDLKKIAFEDIKKLGIFENDDILDAFVIRQEKAYPVYDKDYKDVIYKLSNEIEENYKNLFLVGRNGMHKYNNQDHAMMSSILTVENIKYNTKKNNIWNINVDAEYLESETSDKNKAMESVRDTPSQL